MALIEDETVNYALWIIVAIGALHVGLVTALNYSIPMDLLMLGSDTADLLKIGIGIAGGVNLVQLGTEAL